VVGVLDKYVLLQIMKYQHNWTIILGGDNSLVSSGQNRYYLTLTSEIVGGCG